MLAHIQKVGDYFKKQLTSLALKHEAIDDVRGMGLMLAIELRSPELAKQVAAKMMERRILINRTNENVLRFLPPYILEPEDVDQAISTLDEVFAGMRVPAATV